ncbi:MAG: hypothetical protein RLZZ522_268, partial [Verrucomicrobiota bacterium]
MKTHLLAGAFCAAAATSLFGVVASPEPVALQQSDGTAIRLKPQGDEYLNWFEDAQGFAVVRNGKQYAYADLAPDGQLAPSAHQVGAANPAALGLRKHLKPAAAAFRGARNQALPPALRVQGPGAAPAAAAPPSAVAPVGAVKNLVILCQFSDHDATKIRSQADFDTIFNTVGGHATLAPTGSVRDYFSEASYGTVTLQSTVVAWVTLPQTEAYYAAGTNGTKGAYPTNSQGMVKDALDLADALVDFGQFDGDNNGYVDAIDIIHSGYGAETGGGGGNWIWSHKSALYSVPGGRWTSLDNNASAVKVKVYDYHTEPALRGSSGTSITNIGVICHEAGHFFGLPDLYDTDGSSLGTSSGIGSYCLMANSWGFDSSGQHPPLPSAWCKIQLGWVTPTVVSGGIISAPRVWDNKAIFRVNTGYPSTEYLLIENRQPVGFENVMPQGGLAVWHIDDAKSGNTSEGYPGQAGWPGNNNHYQVALLQADGLFELEKNINRGNAGDVYRSGGVSSLTPATTPNTGRYQGGVVAPSNTSITAISVSGNPMSFTLSNSTYPAITSPLSAAGTQGTPFSYQIVAANSPTSYAATGLPAPLALNTATGLISGTPAAAGAYAITLTATNPTGIASHTLMLSISSSPAEIAVELPVGTDLTDGVASIPFGTLALGASNALTFTVKNTGAGDLTGLAISKNGSHAADFTVGALGATTLAPNATTTFTVTFNPASGGSRAAAIHLASNDADENPFDIALTGIGVGIPEIALEAPLGTNLTDGAVSISCGTISLGSSSPALVFTVKNLGTDSLTGLALTKGGANSADFTVGSLGATSLAAGSSTTFTVVFAPGAAGAKTAAIHLASNDADENPFDLALTGTGVAPPELAVEAPAGTNLVDGTASIACGTLAIGASNTILFTVKNTGAGDLTGLAISKNGTHATDFAVGALGATTLAPGTNTTFTVTFSPSAAGAKTAAIHLASNDSDENPFDINLTGATATQT